ncbi:MAG TPA: C45 family peptidase [Chloroflexota bacterium]|nr:C45 family peptidase [Chloroflexota bacterium]
MYRHADVSALGRGTVLYLKGSPYQQGKQLGRGAAELIHENLRLARNQRQEVASGLDQTDYNEVTRRNERWVSHEFPELLEEITGIAEGAEADYLELLSLNLNSQLSYVYSTVLECTQALAMGPATIDGKTYVGKTRDLSRGPVLQVVLHREYEDGGFTNELKTAGRMTILDGINQHGVSLTCSGQWSPRVRVDVTRADSAWLLLNLQPVLRYARNTDQAVEMIREQPRASGMNVLVADGIKAVALEVTDRVAHQFEPENGLLVRTNHFFAPDLQPIAPTFDENRSTYDRHARASEILRERHGRVSMHDILGILSDHAAPPMESICRHGGADGQSRTYAATINCPQDRTMWVTLGNPCEGIQAVGRPGK